jgi:hypothetical protein
MENVNLGFSWANKLAGYDNTTYTAKNIISFALFLCFIVAQGVTIWADKSGNGKKFYAVPFVGLGFLASSWAVEHFMN